MAITDEHKALEQAYIKLQKQADQLERAKGLLEERNRTMVEELALASELQKSLLPREVPNGIPLTISHRYIPYLSVGGDFFDYLQIGPGRVGIIIADACGHGVASAFLTAMLKSAFTHLAPRTTSPGELLHQINQEFCRTIRTDHYITAFYAIIDTERSEFSYASAGHPRQILIRKDGAEEALAADGFFLGTFESTRFKDKKTALDPGDRLILFTDGLLETTDAKLQSFGRERLVSILTTGIDAAIEDVSNDVVSTLLDFMGGFSFQDDITLLAAEIIESL